jgi:hopanoid biosynthesis associated RND transporter like protein HpnN
VLNFCTPRSWTIIAISGLLTLASCIYISRHFTIDTEINKLISPDLPWRKQELAFSDAFPQHTGTIFAVVEARSAELVASATIALAQQLSKRKDLFQSVDDPKSNPFFIRNGLLYQPTDALRRNVEGLIRARPLVKVMAADRSLRGLSQALMLVLTGVSNNLAPLDDLAHPLSIAAVTIEDELAGRFATFSWRELIRGESPQPEDLRRVIMIRPVLDFSALEPGQKATHAIREIVTDLGLPTRYGARVRLTGPVPIQDEELAILKDGVVPSTIATVALVFLILWPALKSLKLITAVVINIGVGLSVTAALGLCLVGALNPISMAFAVLFIGIGVDFGIQYTTRYRAERYKVDDLRLALVTTAEKVGVPLTLAAAATAIGFFSFLPTAYRGLAELGEIAGIGMIVAYLSSITVLPALLTVFKPPKETKPLGFRWLGPIDHFTERHRIPIIIATILIVLGGLPLLLNLQFDFNIMNLRNPKIESVATYLDLRNDPATGASAIDLLEPSLATARQMAERLSKLPDVGSVRTLETLIPDDQPAKFALIQQAATALGPVLGVEPEPAPSDQETIIALKRAAAALIAIAGDHTTAGADAARHLARMLSALAQANEKLRRETEATFIAPLQSTFDDLNNLLQATPVTEQNIPSDLAKDWITADGRARVQVFPKGDPNNNNVLRELARAVQAVDPTASGGPIKNLEGRRTVVTAFIQAGAIALVSITILLWITLRRFGDVLLTLIPLLLAAIVTLEISAVIGLQLNFANIIALPLLLGVGVAFKIYYIMAWRAGRTMLLQSSLTRAVLFSAMTTASAFGCLCLSSHPGMSSMGRLLSLTLVCTMVAAVLFQPLLMGRPREIKQG